MLNKSFCVMTIDLRRSKKPRNRAFVQKEGLALLEDVNCKFKTDIQAEFMMVLGDEFQGVLISPKENVSNLQVHKKPFRSGILLRSGNWTH